MMSPLPRRKTLITVFSFSVIVRLSKLENFFLIPLCINVLDSLEADDT